MVCVCAGGEQWSLSSVCMGKEGKHVGETPWCSA